MNLLWFVVHLLGILIKLRSRIIQTHVELEIGSDEQSEIAEQSIIDQSSSELTDSNILPTFPTPPIPRYSIAKDRPFRQIRPPQKYGEADLVAYALSVAEDIDSTNEPAIYSEAIICSNSYRWMIAMQKEMESLNKNNT
ncbi:unnamed protein product [Fraxinus pennsylvanica]|uniref:Retrovirus-related Pol polyprotein from transposon TNT 1-94 n=1 Tax=Fraxinus pennsylvanica TaxID=56036 RepID=A0AAD1Z4T3_9LAMI|nr:unnamed protein product [Fraxinus pennsylvanica]